MILTSKIEQIPSSIHVKYHRFYVFCNYMFIFTLVGHLLFIPIFYMAGSKVALAVNIIAVLIDVLALKLNYKGFIKSAPAIWMLWIYAHTLNCIVIFGWDEGFYYYFLSLVIITFFLGWTISARLFVTFILCITTLSMFQFTHMHSPLIHLNQQMHYIMHMSNILANFLAISYALFYYHRYAQQIEGKLLQLAHTDALTGIFNRRYFEQSVNESSSTRKQCAFLLLDIDHFKNINDTYGHAVGDQAIQKVAEICQQSIRGADLVGRVGGEEFAIFLVDVDDDEALKIAERIKNNIEKTECLVEDTCKLTLTVSVGVAFPLAKTEDFSTMMLRADKALYEAKNNGRNQVVVTV